MLELEEADYVKSLSIFAGLDGKVVETICRHCERTEYVANQVVFREGDPAKEMVLILSGSLGVFKRARCGKEVRIASLGPGAVVGEMSLVDIQPRSAQVRAQERSIGAVLSHAAIASIHREHSQSYTLLVLNIAREISIRLRHLDSMLANVLGELKEVVEIPTR